MLRSGINVDMIYRKRKACPSLTRGKRKIKVRGSTQQVSSFSSSREETPGGKKRVIEMVRQL